MLKSISNIKMPTIINTLIMLAIIFGVPMLPKPDGLPEQGMIVGGIFLGILYGWIFIDVVWPSILGLILLAFGTATPMNQVLGRAFGNQTVLLLVFFSMVASIMNAAGLAEYAARKICAVSFVRGRPYVLLFMLGMAMIVLCTLLTMTAAVLVAFPLIKEVARQYGYEPGDDWPQMAMICASYVGDLAYQMLPFKSGPAVAFGVYAELSGGQMVNYAAYMGAVFSITVLGIIFMLLVFKYIVRVDVSKILASKDTIKVEQKLDSFQKLLLWSFIILIILLLWPNVAPKNWAITQFLSRMSTNGILLAFVGLYLCMAFKKGIGLQKIMTLSVPWPVLFLVLTVLTITGSFQAAGIPKWLGTVAEPLLAGHGSYIVVVFFILICITGTQLLNNIAMIATMSPIAYLIGTASGMGEPQIQALLTCIVLSGCLGMATPASSTVAAMLFGDTVWCRRTTIIKYSSIFWLFNAIFIPTVVYGICVLAF